MSTKNEEPKPSNNMELLKQEASACGPGCGCHTVGPSSRSRWVVGVIVLVAAGVLVARAVVRNNDALADAATSGFASMTTTPQTPPPANEPAVAVKELAALSELNTLAVDTDAVFVFLPGKDEASSTLPAAPIQAAAKTIKARAGGKVGIFSLKADSPEYQQLAAQVTPPGVLAMVKGRGMSAVSGEITETKLVQAFVGASSAGGGCGAGSGCGPGSAGCGPRR